MYTCWEGTDLLYNGLQYSIETPLKKYKTDLIIETEQAIRLLDNKLQAHFRILAAKKMKQIIASDSQNIAVKQQNYILNNINKKLDKGQAIITKADKSKTCFIIYTDDYNKKVRSIPSQHVFSSGPNKEM